MFSCLPRDLVWFLEAFCLLELSLTAAPGSAHWEPAQQWGGGCGFSPQGVGSACRPTVGDPLVKFSQWLVGQLPAKVLCIVSKYHVPLMPLDILICLFPSIFRRPYPHPSHGSPALVLWVLLERNEFVQQHPTKLR